MVSEVFSFRDERVVADEATLKSHVRFFPQAWLLAVLTLGRISQAIFAAALMLSVPLKLFSVYFLSALRIHPVYFDYVHPLVLPGTLPPSLQPNFVSLLIFLLNLSPVHAAHALMDI